MVTNYTESDGKTAYDCSGFTDPDESIYDCGGIIYEQFDDCNGTNPVSSAVYVSNACFQSDDGQSERMVCNDNGGAVTVLKQTFNNSGCQDTPLNETLFTQTQACNGQKTVYYCDKMIDEEPEDVSLVNIISDILEQGLVNLVSYLKAFFGY